MKRREKKSESLDIRLPFEQKREFMDATRKQGETASEALRRFIAAYTEEARLTEKSNPVQEIRMTLARHRLKTLASATGAAIGIFAISALPSAADQTAFERLDKNQDGFITEGEILPGEDADIIAKLDTDGSGGVSQAELEAAGNKIVIHKSESTTGDDDKEIVRKKVKIIEFSDDAGEGAATKLTSNVEKRVIVKRIDGEELSQEQLDDLIKDALEEAGVDSDININIDIDEIIEE